MSRRYIPLAERANTTIPLVEGARVYAELKKTVEEEGILDRDYGYYAKMAVFAFGGFFVSAYFIFITSSLWLVILWGLVFTFFTIQVGGFSMMPGIGQFSNQKNGIILSATFPAFFWLIA